MDQLLVSKKMSNVARFNYGSQKDIVKMIELLDPSNLEFYMATRAKTSNRLWELYAKLTGEKAEDGLIHPDYRETTVANIDLSRILPGIEGGRIEDLLPRGISAFLKDLDELAELGKQEKIIPLMRIFLLENYDHKIKTDKFGKPKFTAKDRQQQYKLDRINNSLEDIIYFPRINSMSSTIKLSLGFRPHHMAYSEIRHNAQLVKEVVESVKNPDTNIISYFRIGIDPHDEGNREYYDWVCKSQIYMQDDHPISMRFDEEVDIKELERDLRSKGLDVSLRE